MKVVRILAVNEAGYTKYLWSALTIGKGAWVFLAIIFGALATQAMLGQHHIYTAGGAIGATVSAWIYMKLNRISKAIANTPHNPLWLEIDATEFADEASEMAEQINPTKVAFTQFIGKLAPLATVGFIVLIAIVLTLANDNKLLWLLN